MNTYKRCARSTKLTDGKEGTMADENPEQVTTEKMSSEEPLRVRDEKGLTLGSRLVLRLMIEYNRVMDAAHAVNGDTSMHNVFVQETMIDIIADVIFYGSCIGERLGSVSEVKAYNARHEDEDTEMLDKLREELRAKVREQARQNQTSFLKAVTESIEKKCGVCGAVLCNQCGACHHDHGKPLN
jgi:hypothetical protein